MKLLIQKYKWILIVFGGIILAILIGMAIFLWYQKYTEQLIQNKIDAIHSIIKTKTYSLDNCSKVLEFNTDSLDLDNIEFQRKNFATFSTDCRQKFDISRQLQTLDFCTRIISAEKETLEKSYILLDGFEEVQKQCTQKYMTVQFGTGALFQTNNNFKSSVNVSFGIPFYRDTQILNSKKFIENRAAAKQRFLDLLEISPKIELTPEDITLHPKSGTLHLDLLPETTYTFSTEKFISEESNEEISPQKFTFTTPKYSYFGILKKQSVSLFPDTAQPKFELISYDTDKQSAKVKICRISNNDYATIEVFEEEDDFTKELKDNFFLSGIDTLKAYKCFSKEVVLSTDDKKLKRQIFDFSDVIGTLARSGLYYITFEETQDRKHNEIIQKPIFFGIIDAHITMKNSKNGETFFFVNDLNGKPLANQKIRAHVNEFKSKQSKWNRQTKRRDNTYFSPLNTPVFGTGILLGTTNQQGILQVNTSSIIDGAFDKTFEGGSFDREGNDKSLFITASSDTNISYVSSKWNGGISAWNFGYSLSSYWYDDNEDQDSIKLNRWAEVEPKIYSHSFADRKLYLPWETVHIKSILRDSSNLGIPKNGEYTIKIKNPKGTEVFSNTQKVNAFGWLYAAFDLEKEAVLWSYIIYIYSWDIKISESGFWVEIFKNPKFKNEVMLESTGLNGEIIKDIEVKEEITDRGYTRKTYSSEFNISASILSKYYSWSPVKNADFTYKVYKQYYYDSSYWNNCYYGCYWEPEKEFYSEWKWKLDQNGTAKIDIPVLFSSNYADYKYIVEVTVKDATGDKISGSNALIVRLPEAFKGWNPQNDMYLKTDKRFYKSWENIFLEWGLEHGNFTKEYEKDYVLIIKKKNYHTQMVKDVRGYNRPVTTSNEILEKIIPINADSFSMIAGKVSMNYKLRKTWEYIFEFGKINNKTFFKAEELFQEFQESRWADIQKIFSGSVTANYTTKNRLSDYCDENIDKNCDNKAIIKLLGCMGEYVDNSCVNKEIWLQMHQKIILDDLIDESSRKYFSLISYGDTLAKNPVQSDNKITVLSEKISYKLWETARILVRLPFENGKILWTVEKQWVLSSEYVDVPGNTFFKEIKVDDTFVPNAYIWVMVVDTNKGKIPEYKVGYTEIVVDKTDKKADITIKSNKNEYKPREKVTLNIAVKNNKKQAKPSELTVMVVDDSLISLMGNIDSNSLEKFYKKLPFQIQTSITNIAMLQNYYFSRRGIVWGSGFWNFKGWDSAVSSRNLFKNTAYYNPWVVTDRYGNAKVDFILPDNLTNFRVMVLSNSKDNFFGYAQEFIEVRKDVIVEEKTPLILRGGEKIVLWANIFNTTQKAISFQAELSADGLSMWEEKQTLSIPAGKSHFVTWEVSNNRSCGNVEIDCKIPYIISILGDSIDHSDKIEGNITLEKIPALITKNIVSEVLQKGDIKNLSLKLPDNTNVLASTYSLSLSNNPLSGIEKIVQSLAVYPYGCWEQLLSSTLPNAVLQRFSKIIKKSNISQETIDTNLEAGLEKLYALFLADGRLKYWPNDTRGNDYITSYGVRTFLEIERSWTPIKRELVQKSVDYLVKNYPNFSGTTKAEALWSISDYYGAKTENILQIKDLTKGETQMNNAHELIAFTYGLVKTDKIKYKSTVDKNIIKIQELLTTRSHWDYYYNPLSNTAEFTQLLIDYDADTNLVSKYIQKLYNHDWESYWYSTKTKNNSFLAFAKYIEKYGKENTNNIQLSLNNEKIDIELSQGNNYYNKEYPLSEVLSKKEVALSVNNVSGGALFVTAMIDSYPTNPLLIPSFSHGVDIKRNIFEVTDANHTQETCRWNYTSRSSECTPASGLIAQKWNQFKKGATYKIVLQAEFDENKTRQNVAIEDYLPSGFTILNDKFKTNTIATSQGTTNTNSRYTNWSYIEKRPWNILAYADSVHGGRIKYEYFVRADFEGTFIYPPSVAYLMYQPETRANTKFESITIK